MVNTLEKIECSLTNKNFFIPATTSVSKYIYLTIKSAVQGVFVPGGVLQADDLATRAPVGAGGVAHVP